MGMPGFHGQGSQEFALAAGSVHGYRWWCLDAPDLLRNPLDADCHWPRGDLKGQKGIVWFSGENLARCTYQPIEHEHTLPDSNCGCGFWAYWAPPEKPHFSSSQLWLLGVIKGYGRTLFGTEGFRCQKAQIVALHLASQFEVAAPYNSGWSSDWYRAFSQPGVHHPPHGRPVMSGLGRRTDVSAAELDEAADRMRAWQAVIEDRLETRYPSARIIAERRALLALYPPSGDRVLG